MPSYTSSSSQEGLGERIVRVLVVDDSAYVRKVVSQMLARSPSIEVVGTARNGEEALEMVDRLAPDVVTLDLMMPGMDGVEFLNAQMTRRPLPVVVLSIAGSSSELALKALDAGATDFIEKPTALATERIYEISTELVEKVKTAAGVEMTRLRGPAPDESPAPVQVTRTSLGQVDAVVVGISTGGPQALRYLVPRLPANFPVPIVVVLHMPVGYTELYARRLNEISPLMVREAREGDQARAGELLLAPAGRHLILHREPGGKIMAHLDARPFDTPHRPSVDVLFRSAADVYGSRLLGVVMTGMGNDGLQGAAWIKAHDGLIFTEAEETCVVYGMPRAVVEAGLSDRVVPLDRMAQAILETV